MKGKSNIQKADREWPNGERRVWNVCEYLPEFRTELKVGCDGMAPVIVLE